MSAPPRSVRNARWGLWLPVGVAAVFYGVFIARSAFVVGSTTYFSLFDDAMISMTYGRTLAEGHGLVWYAGAAPVEGYTNFFWTLWMAALHLLPVPEAKAALLVMLSGAAILVTNLLVVHAIARRVFADLPLAAPVAVWLTALYYPLVYWTLRGMEVGLVALLISGATLLALRLGDPVADTGGRGRRDLLLLAGVMAVGVLTRTDAVVPLGVAAAFALWQSTHRRALTAVAGLGVLAATLGGHTIFRLAYYGDALPNTYHLKLGGVSLVERIERGVVSLGWVGAMHLWAAIALAVALFVLRRRFDARWWLLATLFAAQAVYSLYVGGDAWEWMAYANRYLATAGPVLLILAAGGAVAVGRATNAERRRVAALLTVTGLGIAFVALNQDLLPLRLLQAEAQPAQWAVLGALLVPVTIAVAGVWRAASGAVAVVLTAVVLVGVNGQPMAEWARTGGVNVADDARMTRFALTLRQTTEPTATTAVVWAGALPYFSHRPAIDLLGKSDPVIAHLDPLDRPLQPGHTKWDYEYSMNQLRPDVVAQVFSPQAGTLDQIREWGYTEVAHRVFVRDGSTLVDADALRRALDGNPHASRL